jgi:hypothetical protein
MIWKASVVHSWNVFWFSIGLEYTTVFKCPYR